MVYAADWEFCSIPSFPTLTHSTATFPADTREMVVSEALPSSIVHVVVSPANDTFPESSTVTEEFCMSFPVVESKRAIALSVAEAGHTTSPDPEDSVKYSNEVPPAFTRICCSAVPIGSNDWTTNISAGVNSAAVRAILRWIIWYLLLQKRE